MDKKELQSFVYRLTSLLVVMFILISCEGFTTQPASSGNDEGMTGVANTSMPVPEIYQARGLNPLDSPHTYLDTCDYLFQRWNPSNAPPGTIVLAMTFDDTILKKIINEIPQIMNELHAQGFEAINTQDFLSFMERNARIPRRSLLIIDEGSRSAEDFEKKYKEYYEMWGWQIVSGWVSDPKIPEEVWQENYALEAGKKWIDHQAEGLIPGTVLSDESSKVVIARELQEPLEAFDVNFAKKPYAIIWYKGGFGQRPVQAARQLGYQLGFTTNARGPVMFNWVPQADQADPNRPTYQPEGYIQDPLMTLPRYPADEVLAVLDYVRLMGRQAAAFAYANKQAELTYYNTVCLSDPDRKPIPAP